MQQLVVLYGSVFLIWCVLLSVLASSHDVVAQRWRLRLPLTAQLPLKRKFLFHQVTDSLPLELEVEETGHQGGGVWDSAHDRDQEKSGTNHQQHDQSSYPWKK